MSVRSSAIFVAALLIFAAIVGAWASLDRLGLVAGLPPWSEQAAVKSALLVTSLALMAFDRRRRMADYGFRRPAMPARWARPVLLGGALGAAATILVLTTPAAGMQSVLRGYDLLDIVIWIWLLSTFAEEVFTRGWFQTIVEAQEGLRPAVLASGIVFGALHLSLLFRDTDLWTVVIIVSSTSLLGWVAAAARGSSRSLWPAVAAHLAFNVGGTVAGIAFAIASMILDHAS